MKRVPQETIDRYLFRPVADSTYNNENIFGNAQPLKIEIGCGNGHFITELAQEEPNFNFIAIDIKYERVCKTISKLSKRQIDNVRLYHGDARILLDWYIKNESITEFYYNFPDPWPKRKHHKHRLFNSDFLNTLYRVMTQGALFTCATDHEEYLQWMLDFLQTDNRFAHIFDDKVVVHISGYHNTLFEKMWREMGKKIYYFRFIKKQIQ